MIVILYSFGVAQQVFLENLAQPITDGLNRLALIFAVVIVAIDLLVTGVLGVIEAMIERITGDSATFQNGKLVAMTREEMLRQREQQRAKQENASVKPAKTRAPAGPPSVYKLPLPIPGAPGRELSPSRSSSAAKRNRSCLPASAAAGQPLRRAERDPRDCRRQDRGRTAAPKPSRCRKRTSNCPR